MQKMMIVVGAILTMIFGAFSVNAATLTNISGDVKVNKGNGYQAVTKSIFVQTGDKIILGQNAAANILYSNGVSVPVKTGRVAIVKSAFKKPMTVGGAGAAGAAAAATGTGIGIGTTAIVVGAAVAVGVGVAVVVANNKDDAPASP